MTERLRRLSGVLVAVAVLLGMPAPAARASHAALTLQASAGTIRFGQSVTLSGVLTSSSDGTPVAGATVEVLDDGDTVVATDDTNGSGAFSVAVSPARSAEYRARWTDPDAADDPTTSDPVAVQVRPLLSVALSRVRLFGRARVSGRLQPPDAGTEVILRLFRGDRLVATQAAAVGSDGRFVARFDITRPGTFRARAIFPPDEDHVRARASSPRRTTPLPRLGEGDSGVFVELLERRLLELRYRLPGADRRFDFRTGDAVLAFNKVQGRSRVRSVDASTWRALARPWKPRARNGAAGLHIEVDQTRQVLYVVRDGRIRWIVHVSTGRFAGWTRNGAFRVHRKIAGYSPNRLYYPSYFDGLRAVHGWPEVPAYPASHGCVRVPNWTAVWLHGIMPMGTVVRVYHS